MSKNECNICYETFTEIIEIKCCKGKQWCKECSSKVADKCPFCRRPIVNNEVREPVPYNGYFNTYMPYNSNITLPESTGFNDYSFALFPDDLQPSGSVNFSRVENISFSHELSREVPVNIPRYGDLINNMVLRVNLPPPSS